MAEDAGAQADAAEGLIATVPMAVMAHRSATSCLKGASSSRWSIGPGFPRETGIQPMRRETLRGSRPACAGSPRSHADAGNQARIVAATQVNPQLAHFLPSVRGTCLATHRPPIY